MRFLKPHITWEAHWRPVLGKNTEEVFLARYGHAQKDVLPPEPRFPFLGRISARYPDIGIGFGLYLIRATGQPRKHLPWAIASRIDSSVIRNGDNVVEGKFEEKQDAKGNVAPKHPAPKTRTDPHNLHALVPPLALSSLHTTVVVSWKSVRCWTDGRRVCDCL